MSILWDKPAIDKKSELLTTVRYKLANARKMQEKIDAIAFLAKTGFHIHFSATLSKINRILREYSKNLLIFFRKRNGNQKTLSFITTELTMSSSPKLDLFFPPRWQRKQACWSGTESIRAPVRRQEGSCCNRSESSAGAGQVSAGRL